MKINYNIVSLFDTIALVQGLVFGFILIFKDKKNRPSLFLGLFLLSYSICLITSILVDTRLRHEMPSLLFLPTNFYFLSAPLLYIYTKSLIKPTTIKAHLPLLIMGAIEFALSAWLFSFPTSRKLELVTHPMAETYYLTYQFSSLAFSAIFLILIIRLVTKHKSKLLHYYSNVETKQLKWVRAVALIILLNGFLDVISLLRLPIAFGDTLYTILTIGNVIFIYWIAISGIHQKRIEFMEEGAGDFVPQPTINDINDETKYKVIYKKIAQEQLFKNSKLNLPDLANHLGYSRRELSRLINQYSGSNFNQFINQFRIDEAKKILLNTEYDYLNMVGISDEVGFSSKATFFSAFRENAGMPPGQFKKSAKSA